MAEVDETFGLSEEALDELYNWLDIIPLSRRKKNITRDFSDGVMIAEVVAHFLPKMIELHNYFAASSAGQKKINWNTLNRRVFTKLGIRITDNTIQEVIKGRPGAIEQVLSDLRRKIQEQQADLSSRSRSSRYCVRQKAPVTSKSNGLGQNTSSDTSKHHSDSDHQTKFRKQQPRGVTGSEPLPENANLTDYVVARNSDKENAVKNNPPPAHIIYRGHKMGPLSQLENKDREIESLESTNKKLNVKVRRLDTLMSVKDERIEVLIRQEMDRIINGIMRYRRTVRIGMVKQFVKVRDNPEPKAVFFTCMDSRMLPTRFTQTKVGDMFIVRNAGNLVPHSKFFSAEATSTEPAALELGCVINNIRHVIVCGHSDCKAMNLLYQIKDKEFASQHNQILSPLRGWLCNHGTDALKKFSMLEEHGFDKPLLFEGETPMRKFAAYIDPDNRFSIEDKLSQVNCLQQLQNIASYGFLREMLARGNCHLHALWFDIYTGDIYYFSRQQKRFIDVNETSFSPLMEEILGNYT